MSKYGTIRDGFWSPPEETETMHPRNEFRDARDVIVLDGQYRSTGILDTHGDMLYRFPNEIGFGRI